MKKDLNETMQGPPAGVRPLGRFRGTLSRARASYLVGLSGDVAGHKWRRSEKSALTGREDKRGHAGTQNNVAPSSKASRN